MDVLDLSGWERQIVVIGHVRACRSAGEHRVSTGAILRKSGDHLGIVSAGDAPTSYVTRLELRPPPEPERSLQNALPPY